LSLRLSGTVIKIWRLRDNEVATLTFRGHLTLSVTVIVIGYRYRYSTGGGRLPMGGPLRPCVYLAPL